MPYESISFIGQNTASNATSVTLPAHQAGDFLLIHAGTYRGLPITIPVGWTPINSGSGLVSAYKIAQSSTETSGTWVGATLLNSLVYRGVSPAVPVGSTSQSIGFAIQASPTYSTLTMQRTDNSSWLSFASLMSDDTNTTITETGTIGTSSSLRASSFLSTNPIKPAPTMIYTNSATGNRNTASPISSISLTAGNLQQNDLVLIIQSSFDETPAYPTNSGIVSMQSNVVTSGSTNATLAVSYKIMGSTPDTQITFNTTANNRTYAARVLCFRNLDFSNNPIYSINGTDSPTSGAVTPPGLNNDKPQSVFVVAAVGYAGWNPSTPPTNYTGTTQQNVIYNILSSEYTLAVAYRTGVALGFEIPTAWSGSAANAWVAQTIKFEADQGSYLLLNSHDSNNAVTAFAGGTTTSSNAEYYMTRTTEMLAKTQIPPRRIILTN